MSLCCDTMVPLWPASYRGVSFLFHIADEMHVLSDSVREAPECDGRRGGARSESPRIFEGFAYVTSDRSGSTVIVESLATRVQGTLIVPTLGPLKIRCDTFKRCVERDRLGYVCFAVRFVGEIAAAVMPASSRVFDAADAVAAAVVSSFPGSLSLGSGIDYVIDAAVHMVETVAASIELVRTTNLVEPGISIQVEAVSAAITTAAPLLIMPSGLATTDVAELLAVVPPLGVVYSDPIATLGAVIVSTIRLLCAGMAGNVDAGSGALLELALDYPAVRNAEPVGVHSAAAAANSASIVDLVRLAALVAWCEGLVRRSYASRSQAVAARADVAEWLDQEVDHAAANNFVLCATIQDLQNAISRHLTEIIVDFAPSVCSHAASPAPAGDSILIPFVSLISHRLTPERQTVSHFRGGAGALSEDVAASRGNRWSRAAG
jgi:hypothetical protein